MVTTSRAATVNLPTTGIVTVYDKETEAIHSQDYWTNIGADDAEGMTTLMALSINRNYKHGPLRMLFTYDEETNQQGAKTLGPEVLDADYLINIDTGGVGTVTISSAGILRANLKKQYKEVNTNKNKEIDVSIKNLLGGHSGEDIAKDRLCANEMFIDMISLLEEQNITCNIKSVLGGNAANAISSAVDFSILVDSNDVDKVKNLFNEYFDNAKKSHPNEKDASIEIVDWQNPITIAFSDNDSKQIINVLKMIPHGVREMNKDFPNQAATSLNLAIINAGAGSIDICSHSRSQEEPGNDAYDAIYKQIQSDYGYTYEVYNRYSGWPISQDQSFTNLMYDAFKNTGGYEPLKVATHGGLECSRFLNIKPNLNMISIGMDVADEHATTETWYTKSMPGFFAALINCLENANTLKH